MSSPSSFRTQEEQVFDVAVGARIRHYRLLSRLSQTAVANEAGISFQQIQKYESGDNRVSASRLAAIARALNVPISRLLGEEKEAAVLSRPFTRLELDLIENYRRVGLAGRKTLRLLVEALADGKP